jgi:hypothetical protein
MGTSGTAPSGQSHVIPKTSAADRAALEAANARFKQAFADGYRFAVTGTAATAGVAADGKVHIALGAGDRLTARLAKMPKTTYRVHTSDARVPMFEMEGCGEDCGGGSGPPDAFPTPPPNVGECGAAGGVAWGNGSGMGCLGPPGDAIPFCGGSLFWINPGRGRFFSPDGDSFETSWAAENDYGCTFGD